ncbi:hypothetical protein SAMN05421688_3084 [Poseidonocella pacifica]|uniref:Uncharacterized protein n=1 Tax=Poseidonocella pacifica TaxID=871651 RepID=A0A1I0YGS1_9RHOB|nr:hypothetical protein [Poseidonocella pacifica]SFB12569.1 hypothetical protein SAMN05421688_3084 [Poseidonocella pacifica]
MDQTAHASQPEADRTTREDVLRVALNWQDEDPAGLLEFMLDTRRDRPVGTPAKLGKE